MYCVLQLLLQLDRCNTWEEKIETLHTYFPEELDILTLENQKLICSTMYDHLNAVQNYNVTSLPRLKSPITLLKPTIALTTYAEEDYGLHKVYLIRYYRTLSVKIINANCSNLTLVVKKETKDSKSFML